MDQVFIFDKSLQQRLSEYKEILSGFKALPASALNKIWGYYLELTMDPNGWRAIWKISRANCESLDIPFPTVVLVYVLDVDFHNLQALIKVVAVQDDILLPEQHYVPLIHLWPTKSQDKSIALNLSSTANVVDMVRFFYIHLFMPWDLEDDETDWKTLHLETRLRLYYDMKNGMIPRITTEHLNSILTEARHLQRKKELLEIELEDSDIEEGSDLIHINTLTDIHLRLVEIKGEVEILENPLLREGLIRRDQKHSIVSDNDSRDSQIWVIHKSSHVKNYITFLKQVRLLYPTSKVTVLPHLSMSLKIGGLNDSFILSEGKYELDVVGALEIGGTMKGLSCRSNTIVVSALDEIMFDFQGESLVDNITINASMSQCLAVVRKGKVTFSNCIIFGDATSQGMVVLAGGELELINCELFGFFTGIVGNSESKITLQNTEIHDVNFGLKIYDNCLVSINKCVFRECKEYGVCIETENNLNGSKQQVGNFDILQIIPKVSTELLTGMNNGKGDVVINNLSENGAIEDLFSNQDGALQRSSEENVSLEGDDTENELEETVLENVRNDSPVTI